MSYRKHLKKVLDVLYGLITYKNEKYGSSIFQTIKVRGNEGVHILDTEARVHLRILEKLERIANLESFEDRLEEYKDIAGYAILLLTWAEIVNKKDRR